MVPWLAVEKSPGLTNLYEIFHTQVVNNIEQDFFWEGVNSAHFKKKKQDEKTLRGSRGSVKIFYKSKEEQSYKARRTR